MLRFIAALLLMSVLLNGCAYINYHEASPLRQEGINEETVDACLY